MFSNYPDVLNIEQLQEALGVGRSTAYQLVNTEQIKSLRIGNLIRIPKVYLLDYVFNGCYNMSTVISSPSQEVKQ